MKSETVVFPERNKITLEELDLPEIGPEDVLVEIEYSSISVGTERHCLSGEIRFAVGGMVFPFTTGYQAAGVIREAGSGVQDVQPGDRVFSDRGKPAPGWKGKWWGGHSRYHVSDYRKVIKLPESVSTRAASALLLAQVGYNGGMKPKVSEGCPTIVIGDGLVGQYAGQVLKYRGAHVILSGHHDYRLDKAGMYGADEVVNSSSTDFFAWVRDRYPDGIPIAVETAGKKELIRKAAEVLERHGQLVVLGYYPEEECLMDIHWVRAGETTVYFPNGTERGRMVQTLDMLEKGIMKTEELITHEFMQTQAVEAFGMLLDSSQEFLGVVIKWGD